MRCCVGYGEQSERRRERGRVKATRADGWWGERASGRAEGISGVGGGEEGGGRLEEMGIARQRDGNGDLLPPSPPLSQGQDGIISWVG